MTDNQQLIANMDNSGLITVSLIVLTLLFILACKRLLKTLTENEIRDTCKDTGHIQNSR